MDSAHRTSPHWDLARVGACLDPSCLLRRPGRVRGSRCSRRRPRSVRPPRRSGRPSHHARRPQRCTLGRRGRARGSRHRSPRSVAATAAVGRPRSCITQGTPRTEGALRGRPGRDHTDHRRRTTQAHRTATSLTELVASRRRHALRVLPPHRPVHEDRLRHDLQRRRVAVGRRRRPGGAAPSVRNRHGAARFGESSAADAPGLHPPVRVEVHRPRGRQ